MRAGIVGVVLLVMQAHPSGAAEFSTKMFGKEVSIVAVDDAQLKLVVDGVELVKNRYVSIDEIGIVDGMPVFVGDSSNGGNGCSGAPFVVSFPPSGKPRLDGPLDTCTGANHEMSSTALTFSSNALASSDGERWIWTAESGFEKLESVAFVPDASKGWDQLRERTAGHPSDLMNYGVIAARIYQLAGPDKDLLMRMINGVGSGAFEGDWFMAQSCTPHMCTEEEAIVSVSLAEREIYLAWKPSGKKIVVRPPVATWPEKPKQALREWASKWK